MDRRTAAVGVATALAAPSLAMPAVPPEVSGALPAARLVGSGTLRFLGLRIYDARLWADAALPAADFDAHAFALELQYARAFAGAAIADRSIDEMRRAGPLDDARAERWRLAMTRAFVDVQPGDRLTGVHRPGRPTPFFRNAQPTAHVEDADFGRRFFGIWLAETTSEPALRRRLLGLGA